MSDLVKEAAELEDREWNEPSTPYVTDEADILHDIRNLLATIDAKLDNVVARMNSCETMVSRVVDEVKPTIDELMSSNLVKMLGLKKREKNG